MSELTVNVTYAQGMVGNPLNRQIQASSEQRGDFRVPVEVRTNTSGQAGTTTVYMTAVGANEFRQVTPGGVKGLGTFVSITSSGSPQGAARYLGVSPLSNNKKG